MYLIFTLLFRGFKVLKIAPAFVLAAQGAESAPDLGNLLQNALRLEHATVPAYLTAAYSIRRNTNTAIFTAIKDIAEEEMLHMALVANLINAIGSRPDIANPEFLPRYPGPLPMAIGNGLIVGLKPLSRDLVHDVFMEIEKPENPLLFPVKPLAAGEPEFATIGEFYKAIIDRILELGDGIFSPRVPQVTLPDRPGTWERLTPITDTLSAVKALQWIMEDGEGTPTLPFDGSGDFAHYYRFEEIFHGRKLIPDANAPLRFAYAGDPVPLDTTKIWPLPENPKAADYSAGSDARRAVDSFNQFYSDMLRSLQRAFDGEPTEMTKALSLMGRLRSTATQLVQLVDPGSGKRGAPTYEYMPALVS